MIEPSQQPDSPNGTPTSRLSGDSTPSCGLDGSASQAVEDTLPLVPDERYADGFDLQSPIELLYLVDDDIKDGHVKLHDWQVQFMEDFADRRHTKNHPFLAEVRAANGSGKDKYILAACIVWMCMRYRKAYGVATNGSGVQLDTQTEFHIRNLCQKVNSRLGFLIWKCNYRSYFCIPTQSPIELFATDEPNKAEGFHPIEANTKLAIFASEAKAIPDTIFAALTRCTGATHRVDVSSPGLPAGHFFNMCQVAIKRNSLKDIKDCPPTERVEYHITAYDCNHITENEIELFAKTLAAQGGRNSPVFRSGILAEFGTTDELTVIDYTAIHRCKTKQIQWQREQFNQAGLDFAQGGAESVLKVRNGNKVIATEAFRFNDTEDTIEYLEELFVKHDLKHPESLIWGDCCGIGYPMLCSLRKRGWSNIRFFDSRHASSKPKVYKNIVTEMWFALALLVQRAEIIMDGDMLTETQLVSRYYKITGNNVHQLLSKLEQKAKGYPSPDRADALVYSFIGYKSTYVERVPVSEDRAPVPRPLVEKPKGKFVQQMLSQPKDSINRRLGKRPDMSYLQSQLDALNMSRKQTTN